MKQRFRRLSDWFGLNDGSTSSDPEQEQKQDGVDSTRTPLTRRSSKKVIPGLPRPATFKRQLSEQRERLLPHERSTIEPRDISAARQRATSEPSNALLSSPHRPESPPPPFSSTEETSTDGEQRLTREDEKQHSSEPGVTEIVSADVSSGAEDPPPPFTPWSDDGDYMSEAALEEELEKRWILNLSMHFRDRSDREKFFVTFAEAPNRWRRLTISLDYRDAPPDSLERDIKELRYQREKSARIYEAIRESLPEIQFYNSVTNLKLQTTDGRLHVHVTQDMNEIISYPPRSTIKHLECPVYPERAVEFESHLSGFVYKVNVNGRVFIKKEIPGPDAVDEFLYEINALHSLRNSKNVIQFGGVIIDDEGEAIKGLLISFASKGAMIDLLYEEKGDLSWSRRERWAYQIVRGLSEIHEAGYVQGDLTLSNIVIDEHDDGRIIDINRRGCPVGWEPPEMKGLIASNQKVGMYIGVKSDLYQLGMVLWSLAMENDQPEVEIQRGSLGFDGCRDDIPGWYRDVVRVCLSQRPQDRISAKVLLGRFPEDLQSDPGDIDGIKMVGDDDPNKREDYPESSAYTPPRGRTLHPHHFASEDQEPLTFNPIPISIPSSTINEDLNEEEPQIISISPPASRSPSPSSPNSPKSPSDSIPQPFSVLTPNTDTTTTTADTAADTDTTTTNKSTADATQTHTASDRWEEIEIQGNPYLIRRSELERLKLEVDANDVKEKDSMQRKEDTVDEKGDMQLQEQEKEKKREKEVIQNGSQSPVDNSPVLVD